ncbi:UDP-3-O-(3-hydroxymyristoyl)glucosamine N-acyltransferase [Thiomonas bhubaneswarensis]
MSLSVMSAPGESMEGLTLEQIANRLGGELVGSGQVVVRRLRPLASATRADITFLNREKLRPLLAQTDAAAVILPESLRGSLPKSGNAIFTADPYLYYARLSQWFWALAQPAFEPGCHVTAQIDPAARVSPQARVDAFAVVEAGAEIAEGAHIGAGCFVGRDAVIGPGTVLHPRSSVAWGCRLGARCVLQSGAVVGSDGFGYARDASGAGVKIAQVGIAVLEDDVEVGANSTIDRGALDNTEIGTGVKIDNLVQIAHNVRIGAHTALAGCVGVSGSAEIGAYCFIGGGVGIAGHLSIVDGVVIGGMSLVSRSVRQPGMYTGAFPLDTHANWERNAATVRQLHQLRDRVRHLEQHIESLKSEPST